MAEKGEIYKHLHRLLLNIFILFCNYSGKNYRFCIVLDACECYQRQMAKSKSGLLLHGDVPVMPNMYLLYLLYLYVTYIYM